MTSPQPRSNSTMPGCQGHDHGHHPSVGAGTTAARNLIFSPNSSAAALALSALAGTATGAGGGSQPGARAAAASAATSSAPMNPKAVIHGFGGNGPSSSVSLPSSSAYPMTTMMMAQPSTATTSNSPADFEGGRSGGAGGAHLPPATRLFSNTNRRSSSSNSSSNGALEALSTAYQHSQSSRTSSVGNNDEQNYLDDDGLPVIPATVTSSFSSTTYSSNSINSLSVDTRRQSFGVTWAPTPSGSSSDGGGAMMGSHQQTLENQYTPMYSMYGGSFVAPHSMITNVTPSPQNMGLPTPKKFKMEMEDGTAVAIDPSGVDVTSYENHNLLATAYSRKKKSLGVLADNFLDKYKTLTPGTHIIIDVAAQELGVERRRIYDIVNILESIGIVCKVKKNTYSWMGMDRLPCVFGTLQEMAIPDHPDDARVFLGVTPPPSPDGRTPSLPGSAADGQQPNDNTKKSKESRSLAKLAQEFLQVYLVGNEVLSLPQASDKILGAATQQELITLGGGPANRTVADTIDLEEQRKLRQAASRGLKTKIRRLYDIANVFLSVGLLTKVENKNNELSRRPHFRWSYHMSSVDIYQLHNQRVMAGGDSKEVGMGIKL